MSVETLTGGAHGKGEVDLYLAKLKLKEYLLGSFMERHAFESSSKVTLRSVFATHQTYRTKLKPIATTSDSGSAVAELSWCAGWSDSAMKLLAFIEDRARMVAIVAKSDHWPDPCR